MLDNFYQGEGVLEVCSVQSVPINTNCCYNKAKRGCVGRVTTCVCSAVMNLDLPMFSVEEQRTSCLSVGRHGYNVNRQIKFIPLAYMTVLDVTC